MTAIDQRKLDEFLGKFVSDFGASLHAPTIILGEKLGLYKAMAEEGRPVSAEERYVREWLAAQASAGYAMYDEGTNKYWLTPEQAFTLADENSPAYLPGA